VGHVTKEGTLAGPKVLEHLVDTVLSFEGDRHHALRMLRAAKHRFGSTEEVGLFELGESGLAGVPDASGLFLGDARAGTPGSVVVPIMEGQRPLLVELQALVVSDTRSPAAPIPPRRSAQGLDHKRLALLLAVLQQRLRYRVGTADVYVSAVGGVRINEPGADLALALAVVSALSNIVVPTNVIACGEVGLGGEVRQVAHLERRLREAARLGFARAIVPLHAPEAPSTLEVVRIATLREAIEAMADHAGSIDSRGDLA
jgi:DNA repair protein RadA/Sms